MAQANISVSYEVKEGRGSSSRFSLQDDFNGEATLADLLKFTKGALIRISTDALREEQDKGFDKKPTLVVDGKFNRSINSVDPLGKIQYVARQSLRELILETYDAIRYRTKIVTGEYSRNNIVTFNGLQIANNKEGLVRWLESHGTFEDKDIFRFVNTAPYARKLERYGITAQRSKQKIKKIDKKKSAFMNQVQVPNGTYALAFKAIQRKYKNNAFIRFRLVLGSDIGLVGNGRVYKTQGKSFGRPYMYPSILISAVGAGMTDGKGSLQ